MVMDYGAMLRPRLAAGDFPSLFFTNMYMKKYFIRTCKNYTPAYLFQLQQSIYNIKYYNIKLEVKSSVYGLFKEMSKLRKFLIIFDNPSLLYFPSQFLTGELRFSQVYGYSLCESWSKYT
jgi:hypothetical protein